MRDFFDALLYGAAIGSVLGVSLGVLLLACGFRRSPTTGLLTRKKNLPASYRGRSSQSWAPEFNSVGDFTGLRHARRGAGSAAEAMNGNAEFEQLSHQLSGLWPQAWVEAATRAQVDFMALTAEQGEISQLVVQRSWTDCHMTMVGHGVSLRTSGVRLLDGAEFAEITLPVQLDSLVQTIGRMELQVTDSHQLVFRVEIEALAVVYGETDDETDD